MYVCVCVEFLHIDHVYAYYMSKHIHESIYIYIYIHIISRYTYIDLCIEINFYMYACMHVRMYVCTYVRMYVCMYVRTYMYMYMQMHIIGSKCS